MTITKTRKYSWGKLTIKADMAQASSPIKYSTDGEDFDSTPLQVADSQHDWRKAFSLVNQWLKGQAA